MVRHQRSQLIELPLPVDVLRDYSLEFEIRVERAPYGSKEMHKGGY